ncbi:Gfo/Idh/MocA family oxidoreductase [Roseibium sp. FZY0029]|uniref:Gfo/Idh/MocA family protein n=1 Tax=Roseibium sp. FZY0029 TaxID=3116647 RepID=UPI002EC5C5A0|nr:Gfo/Idh/MocA family oxidoreductase [Roseibium sp. FZY0029]
MPDLMTQSPILLVGAGLMAQAYAKVLLAQNLSIVVLGRGEVSARAFEAACGVPVFTGELDTLLQKYQTVPHTAIVAVSAQNLYQVSRQLLSAGCNRLLVEKPAGLTLDEVCHLSDECAQTHAEMYVAYNRRFYASTAAARAGIIADGGPLSVKFDFTEASRRIEVLSKPAAEFESWFFGNSTHVIDLAFFLGGTPSELLGKRLGQLSWHSEGAVFTGHGKTVNNALISYHANWLAPGRWGVEIMTRERRYVLQPMEQLFIQEHTSFSLTQADIDDSLDKQFKPGLYKQVEAFLNNENDDRLLSIEEHAKLFRSYQSIRDGGFFSPDAN